MPTERVHRRVAEMIATELPDPCREQSRLDPRTGIVPAEPLAPPFRDSNQRVTAECAG